MFPETNPTSKLWNPNWRTLGEQQHSHLKKKHQFSIFFLPQIPTSLATNKFYVQYSGSPPSASFRYISAERPVVNRYKQTCPESSKHPPLLHFARDLDMMMIWIFRVHSSLWSFFVQITVANYQPIFENWRVLKHYQWLPVVLHRRWRKFRR